MDQITNVPEPQPFERRICDAIERSELHTVTLYATKVELAGVTASLHAQGLDVIKMQLELEGIRKALDRINTSMDRVVWIVLTSVIVAGLGLIVRPLVFG